MPPFHSPFSSCLSLAMADSYERDLRASQPLAAQPAQCTSPNFNTTLQPSALTTPSSMQPGFSLQLRFQPFYRTVIYQEVADTKPHEHSPLCTPRQCLSPSNGGLPTPIVQVAGANLLMFYHDIHTVLSTLLHLTFPTLPNTIFITTSTLTFY